MFFHLIRNKSLFHRDNDRIRNISGTVCAIRDLEQLEVSIDLEFDSHIQRIMTDISFLNGRELVNVNVTGKTLSTILPGSSR